MLWSRAGHSENQRTLIFSINRIRLPLLFTFTAVYLRQKANVKEEIHG